MTSLRNSYRKFLAWFSAAKDTEKASALIIAFALLATVLYLPASALNNYIDETSKMATTRRSDLIQVNKHLAQYRELNGRLEKLKISFDESSMTFEEVTTAIDEVVKQSIGSDNYSLRKVGNPSQLGFDYEKQDFQITIRQASLDQVVKLLHRVEQGERPLFLGNVNLVKVPQKDEFTADLRIFSVRKS